MKPAALPTAGDIVLDPIELDDGRLVDMAFYGSVHEQVESRLPMLSPSPSYTARMLCGDEFWSQLRPGEPSLAGRCLAHMVEEGVLPLRNVKTRHEYPKRYRRT